MQLLRFALSICILFMHVHAAQAQDEPHGGSGYGVSSIFGPIGMLAKSASVAKVQEAPRYNLGFGTCGPIPGLPQALIYHPEATGHTTDATLRLQERLLVGAAFTYYRTGGSFFHQDSTHTTSYRPLLNFWAAFFGAPPVYGPLQHTTHIYGDAVFLEHEAYAPELMAGRYFGNLQPRKRFHLAVSLLGGLRYVYMKERQYHLQNVEDQSYLGRAQEGDACDVSAQAWTFVGRARVDLHWGRYFSIFGEVLAQAPITQGRMPGSTVTTDAGTSTAPSRTIDLELGGMRWGAAVHF